MVYSKTITITAQDLGRDATLMLTFDPPPGAGLFRDYFPIAWKVGLYPAIGYQSADFTYTAQLMFNKAQVLLREVLLSDPALEKHSTFFVPGTRTPINVGQSTTLINYPPGSGSFVWETPSNFGGNTARAVNGTSAVQDIGVGFLNGKNTETILYFSNVGVQLVVAQQIRALLKIYVTSDYKQGETIRANIGIQPILEINMADVGVPTDYLLTYSAMTATFKLTPDFSNLPRADVLIQEDEISNSVCIPSL